MNTELRTKTYNRLVNLIKIINEDLYIKKIYNNKVYYIAYVGLEGFKSFLIDGRYKMYLFIKEELTEEERIKEIDYVINGNMKYFDKEEIERIINKQKSIKIQFGLINHDDIEIIMSNARFREYNQIKVLSDEIDDFIKSTDRQCWDTYGKLLYMFKIGLMQGKREERARRKKVKND